MNYWHMQLHPYKNDWNKEKELLERLSLIGLGVIDNDYINIQNKQFSKKMEIGDIVLIRHGQKVIALVEVLSECIDNKKNKYDNLDWFRYRRKVKVLEYAKDMPSFPQQRGALQQSINKRTKSYQYIHNWYTKIIQKDYDKEKLKKGTYKLKELYIYDNQKIFQDFKIDFTSDGKNPLPVIVIAGKNGIGKTTLLEYLANCEIKNSDYVKIFSVREAEKLEVSWDDEDELIVDNLYIKDEINGIQSLKRNYLEHIEYLPVYSSKIKDVKDFILQKHRKRSRELDSIKKATKEIGSFIEKIFKGMDLSFSLVDVDDTDRDNEKVTFKNKSGKEFDIDNLSTGEKTLLSKVLYLYFKDIKNQIILIDEPELSLHPAWQNRVLKLYENFAKENNCQIIIATHSPHIIGSAKAEYIRLLTEDGVIDNFSQSYGLEFNQILTDIMEVRDLRTPEVNKKFSDIKKMIINNDFDTNKFKERWKELEDILGKNYLDLKLLKLEIASRRKNVQNNKK